MEKTEPENEEESEPEQTKPVEKKKRSKRVGIPCIASINDILKAVGILSDKGGEAKLGEMVEGFGGDKKARLLSASLGALTEYGLIEHKKGGPYRFSDDGKKFVAASEDQKKAILLPRFLRYKWYRDILIRMKNETNKSMKKEVITNAWMNIINGGSGKTRGFYTMTFSSVGSWCGAIKDTGRICSLTTEGERVLSEILKGEEEAKPLVTPGKPITPVTPVRPIIPSPVTYCPFCTKTEIDPKEEKLLDTITTNGTPILIISRTYHCRGCTREFTRIIQQAVETAD